jgi:hypothetical protein
LASPQLNTDAHNLGEEAAPQKAAGVAGVLGPLNFLSRARTCREDLYILRTKGRSMLRPLKPAASPALQAAVFYW